jgi:hypothetical protein
MGYDHMHHLAHLQPRVSYAPEQAYTRPPSTVERYAKFYADTARKGFDFTVRTAPVWGPAAVAWARSPQGQQVIGNVIGGVARAAV